MIKKKDLSEMTDNELSELEQMIAQVREKRKTESAAISEIKKLMLEKGLTEERLAEALGVPKKRPDAGKRAPVKYRHPADKTKEWSGRGKRPNWLIQALDEGLTMDSMAV